MNYSVIVGNIGTVGHFTNKADARKCFSEYRKLSRSQYGRASGESVAIFRGAADSESDAELIAEFIPTVKQLKRPTRYNGWSNRETWIVNLWFNPESKADLEYVREHLEEELDKIESGVLKDMINLGAINWRELEEACCEYEEEDEEQPS